MTSCTGSARGRFWGIRKMSVELSLCHLKKKGDFHLLAEARSVGFVAGATRDEEGADEKARIERICISPYVEEPLNSKVIKSFVPELRSRKCFSCFEIPMFYVIYIYMNIICPFHTYPYLTIVQKVSILNRRPPPHAMLTGWIKRCPGPDLYHWA